MRGKLDTIWGRYLSEVHRACILTDTHDARGARVMRRRLCRWSGSLAASCHGDVAASAFSLHFYPEPTPSRPYRTPSLFPLGQWSIRFQPWLQARKPGLAGRSAPRWAIAPAPRQSRTAGESTTMACFPMPRGLSRPRRLAGFGGGRGRGERQEGHRESETGVAIRDGHTAKPRPRLAGMRRTEPARRGAGSHKRLRAYYGQSCHMLQGPFIGTAHGLLAVMSRARHENRDAPPPNDGNFRVARGTFRRRLQSDSS